MSANRDRGSRNNGRRKRARGPTKVPAAHATAAQPTRAPTIDDDPAPAASPGNPPRFQPFRERDVAGPLTLRALSLARQQGHLTYLMEHLRDAGDEAGVMDGVVAADAYAALEEAERKLWRVVETAARMEDLASEDGYPDRPNEGGGRPEPDA